MRAEVVDLTPCQDTIPYSSRNGKVFGATDSPLENTFCKPLLSRINEDASENEYSVVLTQTGDYQGTVSVGKTSTCNVFGTASSKHISMDQRSEAGLMHANDDLTTGSSRRHARQEKRAEGRHAYKRVTDPLAADEGSDNHSTWSPRFLFGDGDSNDSDQGSSKISKRPMSPCQVVAREASLERKGCFSELKASRSPAFGRETPEFVL